MLNLSITKVTSSLLFHRCHPWLWNILLEWLSNDRTSNV